MKEIFKAFFGILGDFLKESMEEFIEKDIGRISGEVLSSILVVISGDIPRVHKSFSRKFTKNSTINHSKVYS